MPENRYSVVPQIAWNTVTGWASLFVNGVLSFALTPYLIRELGSELYGLSAVAMSIVMTCGLFDMGFHKGISRQLAAAQARDDSEEFDRVVSSSFVLLVPMSITLAAVLVILAKPLVQWLCIQSETMPQAVLAVGLLGGVAVVDQFASPVFTGIITSCNRFDMINVTNPIISLLRSCLLLILVIWMGLGFRWWIYIMTLERILHLLSLIWISRRVGRCWRIRFGSVSIATLKSVFSVGGFMFLGQVSTMLSSRVDPMILSRFLGTGAVSLYAPSLLLASYANPFVNMLSSQLHPLATRFSEQDSIGRLRSLLLRGTRYGGLMGTLVSVFLFAYSNDLCRIWLGQSLPDGWGVVASALRWWVVFEYTTYLASAQWPVILGMNRVAFLAATQIPFAVLNFLASIALVAWTDLGVVGVVIPTAVVGILRRPILFWYCNRITKTSWFELWSECGWPLGVNLAGLTVMAWGMLELWPPMSWLGLFTSAAALTISWFLLVVLTARPVDRELISLFCNRTQEMLLKRVKG